MDKILEALTDGLIELRSKVSTSQEDIAKINEILKEIQSNQLNKSEIEKLVILLATGYFKTKNDDYDTMINSLMDKITYENKTQIDTIINQSIEAFKSDLSLFKSTIKNGKDGKDGNDGLDGKDGRNGLSGRDGKDGISGYSGQPNEVIKIGSSSFLTFDNPEAKAYYMEFSGDGLGTIQNIITLKEKRMAVLGARLLLDEKKTAEATETVAMRSSGERAVLINIALTLSSGLKKVLSIIAEWENIKQEIVYNLNTDYNLSTMDAQLLAQIMAGVQGGTIPPQVLFHNMKEGELIPDDMDYEMYQSNIETATPQMSVNTNTKALMSKLGL